MRIISEFKEFAMRGNVVDMAVGIIIGGAFGTIAQSLVKDVIMPPLGFVLGNVDFSNLFVVVKEGGVSGPYSSIVAAQSAGAVTLNYGMFINSVVSFLIVAFAVFLLIKGMNRIRRREQISTKECPYCLSVIPQKAHRCKECTVNLGGGKRG